MDNIQTQSRYQSTLSSAFDRKITNQLEDYERAESILKQLLESNSNQFTITEVHNNPTELMTNNKKAFDHLSLYHNNTDLRENSRILVVTSQQYEIDQDFYFILLGPWVEFTYTVGSTLTFLGKLDEDSYSKVLNRYRGEKKVMVNGIEKKEEVKVFSDIDLLILDPEVRVKVTDLTGDNKECDRFNVLNRFYNTYGGYNKWGLDGTIQHNLFEEIISKDVQSEKGKSNSEETDNQLKSMIYDQMAKMIGPLYQIQDELPYREEFDKLLMASRRIKKWRNTYIRDQEIFFEETSDSQNQVFIKKDIVSSKTKERAHHIGGLRRLPTGDFHPELGVRIRLKKVEGTEVRYDSELYGLVGIVDALIVCELEDPLGYKKELNIPFELKTGKHIKPGYEIQVQLYNLMMNEQFNDRDNGYGIVYYSNLEEEPIFTKMSPNRLYDTFMKRNMIVSKEKNLKMTFKDLENVKLPPRTQLTNSCRFCDVKAFCIAWNTFEHTYNSVDKKKAFVLKFEEENANKMDEISGLMEYKNHQHVTATKRKSA